MSFGNWMDTANKTPSWKKSICFWFLDLVSFKMLLAQLLEALQRQDAAPAQWRNDKQHPRGFSISVSVFHHYCNVDLRCIWNRISPLFNQRLHSRTCKAPACWPKFLILFLLLCVTGLVYVFLITKKAQNSTTSKVVRPLRSLCINISWVATWLNEQVAAFSKHHSWAVWTKTGEPLRFRREPASPDVSNIETKACHIFC